METRNLKRAAGFFPGKNLPEELRAAMKRVSARGFTYPAGYESLLIEKYSEQGVCYPHILMIIGIPQINFHFFYPQALKRAGRVLDYGSGTGDNVCQLLRDGFSREGITAFDINMESIDLGFDLYRDREESRDLFVVPGRFPFEAEEFDTIYSASVIHLIADEKDFRDYQANARSALRSGGIFFGSTLGLGEGAARPPGKRGPPRILTLENLAGSLTGAGFSNPVIVRREGVPDYVPHSEDLCLFEFCTEKPESSGV